MTRFARKRYGDTSLLDIATRVGVSKSALWLLALWDGLQYEWLCNHESVDVAAQLRAHFADILAIGRDGRAGSMGVERLNGDPDGDGVFAAGS